MILSMFDDPCKGVLALTIYVLCAFTGVAHGHPYDQWAEQHFGTPFEQAGRIDADPDGGGDPNLVEFALGSEPKNARSRTNLVPTLGEFNGRPHVILRYPRRISAQPYVRYLPQASTDLAAWQGVGGPLGLVDELDPDQTPRIPAFQWWRAAAPVQEGGVFLRLELVSLTELWQRIQERRLAVQGASDWYAMVMNLTHAAPFDWPRSRQFLPMDSPLREIGPVDLLGNPFIASTIGAGVQVHPDTAASIGAGADPALHIHTWDTLTRALVEDQTNLEGAIGQYSIETNRLKTDPVSWELIEPYVRHDRMSEVGPLDPLGNAYVIGPTVADSAAFHPSTLQYLQQHGWLENGYPKLLLTDKEKYQQLMQDQRVLNAALDQWAIENNKSSTSPVSYEDIQEYYRRHPRLQQRNGKDVFGNDYLVGPLVLDGVRVSPETLSALAGTWQGALAEGIMLRDQVNRDLSSLWHALWQHHGYTFPSADYTITWALLEPHVPVGSAVQVTGGKDPLGRPYLIGPTFGDSIRVDPATVQHLEDAGALRPDAFYPNLQPIEFIIHLLNDHRILEAAVDQYTIEQNQKLGATVSWSHVLPYLSGDMRIRQGRDLFGNFYDLRPVGKSPKISLASVEHVNAHFSGRSTGNMTLAAHWMPGDLARIREILDLYQAAHSLPDDAPVTWDDIVPWLPNVEVADTNVFHREYGFDSLGNRPVIGPTLEDPVQINPASLAAILAAEISYP